VNWVDPEFVLVSLAAMLSPLTLTWSVLSLVLSQRPLRTGLLFYLGAFGATLAVGVAAAFVLGNAAASHSTSTPTTWVSVIDVIGGVLLLIWVVRLLRRPANPAKEASMVKKMGEVASSSAIAIITAGAVLGNPGVFIPLALKTISELNPSSKEYILEWVAFTFVSLLPLATAIVMLLAARDQAERILGAARDWLELHARTIAAAIVILLAASLLRGGIAGLASSL
jgi:hypothetical protein